MWVEVLTKIGENNAIIKGLYTQEREMYERRAISQ